MNLDNFVALYLDYRNNFLSVRVFASHHGLSFADAQEIVFLGRAIGNIGSRSSIKTLAELEAEKPEDFRNPL